MTVILPLRSINDLSLDRWRSPLVSRSPDRVEVVLKVHTVLEDSIILGPVLIAVLEDLTDISLELRGGGVLVSAHLALDGAQVHRSLDDIEIVGDVVDGRINGVLEGSDEASPEARAFEHAHDEVAAELHLLLWGERDHFSCGWTRSAAIVADTTVGL